MKKSMRLLSLILSFVIFAVSMPISGSAIPIIDRSDLPGNKYTVTISYNTKISEYNYGRRATTLHIDGLIKCGETGMPFAYISKVLPFSGSRKASYSATYDNIPEGSVITAGFRSPLPTGNGEVAMALSMSEEDDMIVGKDSYGFFDVRSPDYDPDEGYGEIRITVKYTHTDCKVIYNVDGSSSVPKPELLRSGKPIGNLPVPQREGYDFLGWFTEPEGETKIDSDYIVPKQKELTLYSRWQPKYGVPFTTALDPSGGSVSPGSFKAVTGEPYGELPIPRKTGYDFISWFTEPEFQNPINAESIALPTEFLYAKWSPASYNVTFDAAKNGGALSHSDMTVIYDAPYCANGEDLPVPHKENQAFLGWFTEPDGGTQITGSSIVSVPEDHTLYARFVPLVTSVDYLGDSNIIVYIGYPIDISDNVCVLPSEESTLGVIYSSSFPSSVSVSKNGVITGSQPGTSVITIAAADGTGEKAEIVVTALNVNEDIYASEMEDEKIGDKNCKIIKNSKNKNYHSVQSDKKYGDVFKKYGSSASCYAMGLSIMFGKKHTPTEYMDPETGMTAFTAGHISKLIRSNEGQLYRTVYNNLCLNLPSMLRCTFGNGKQHWVLVVGVDKKANDGMLHTLVNLQKEHFVVVDPANGKVCSLDEAYGFCEEDSIVDGMRSFVR